MKNILFLSLFLLMLNACSDPCSDIDCGPNGTCIEGECSCDEGYEGMLCDTETRAKYLGLYSGDISSCFEGLEDLGAIPEGLTVINAVVEESPDNINFVSILPSSAVLPVDGIVANPSEGITEIPLMTNTIELEDLPFPLTISVSGSVEFIDEDNFVINLIILVPLLQAINCSINMTRV